MNPVMLSLRIAAVLLAFYQKIILSIGPFIPAAPGTGVAVNRKYLDVLPVTLPGREWQRVKALKKKVPVGGGRNISKWHQRSKGAARGPAALPPHGAAALRAGLGRSCRGQSRPDPAGSEGGKALPRPGAAGQGRAAPVRSPRPQPPLRSAPGLAVSHLGPGRGQKPECPGSAGPVPPPRRSSCLCPKNARTGGVVHVLKHLLGLLGFMLTVRVVLWDILELRCADGRSQKDADLLATLPHKNNRTFLPELTRGAAVRRHRN